MRGGSGFVALSPRALAMARGLENGDDFFRENWPIIGESGPTGVPGKGVDLPDWDVMTMDNVSLPGG